MQGWLLAVSPSREAAKECSPRRKPWVAVGTRMSPSGAKDTLSLPQKSRRSSATPTLPQVETLCGANLLNISGGITETRGRSCNRDACLRHCHFGYTRVPTAAVAIVAQLESECQDLGCHCFATLPAFKSRLLRTLQSCLLQYGMSADQFSRLNSPILADRDLHLYISHNPCLSRQWRIDRRGQLR